MQEALILYLVGHLATLKGELGTGIQHTRTMLRVMFSHQNGTVQPP